MARRWGMVGLVGGLGLDGGAAMAGMPSITLTDVASLRFQAISFFLMVFLTATWGVRALWNGLRGDFPGLPRLSFGRAPGLVGLWGLVFLLVLTMISGARELMTPGAGKKVGLTYKPADGAPPPTPPVATQPARQLALGRLKLLLWDYAGKHDGRLPANQEEADFPAEFWLVPDAAAVPYIYVPGQRVGAGPVPVAFEPELFGPERLTLRADGSIAPMSTAAVERARRPEGAR